MDWIIIILVAFVAALLLIGRLYVGKSKNAQETSRSSPEQTDAAGQADTDAE